MKNKWKDILPLVIIATFFLIVCVLIIRYGPEWVIRTRMADFKGIDKDFKGEGSGTIGDTFGGALGPLVGLLAGFLTFLAFWIQYRANQVQKMQFERQSQDAIFFKSLDDLQSKIEHANFNINSKQIDGYNVLSFLVKEYKILMNKNISIFSRNLICENPELAGHLFFSKIYGIKYFITFDFGSFHQEFLKEMALRDRNERWEYLKRHVNSVDSENSLQLDALRALGSINYYKINFSKRFHYYQLIYNKFISAYGSFLDGYYANLEFVLGYIEDSINRPLYIKYLKFRLSRYDQVLIFYYLISGNGSERMYILAKDYLLFEGFVKCNNYLIDLPSKGDIDTELEFMFTIPDISEPNVYSGRTLKSDINQ